MRFTCRTVSAIVWLIAGLVFCSIPALGATAAGLKPQALVEISALMDEKASWTPTQRKMDSALVQVTKKRRGQAFAPSVKNLRSSVKVELDGRVLVDIKAKVTPALLASIKQGGGVVINSFPQNRAIHAFVTLNQLEGLAASPDVTAIRRGDRAYTDTGSVTSQGDWKHSAVDARDPINFGATGAGVKVGVLSDGVDYLPSSIVSGDLPLDTMILPGQAGTGTEGAAMLEIIHDLAPQATLYFATALGGPTSFSNNIVALHEAGCNIIVDDVRYDSESPFQDDVIAKAVSFVTAHGALYFASAGNIGNKKADRSGTWEGDFQYGGEAGNPIKRTGQLHRFGANTYNRLNSVGKQLSLFWSDPLGGSGNDYDLFVLDPTAVNCVASSMMYQTGTQDPYETIETRDSNSPLFGPNHLIVIVKYSGDARFLYLATEKGLLDVSTSGAIKGHASATNAIAVAAVTVVPPSDIPFTGGSDKRVAGYSADGPRRVFFHDDGTSIKPNNFLFMTDGGAERPKPDIAAAAGVATSVPGFSIFSGTSAAAPHAAAVAALLLSDPRGFTPSEVRSALIRTALDIEDPGLDRESGAGIVMAYQSMFLTAPASATEGIPIGQGQVRISTALSSDLTITLGSSDISEVQVPSSVTIPAGNTSGTFDITAVDDGVLDGTQTATITASTLGFSEETGSITVHDRQTAILTVTLPSDAAEGDGTRQGTVTVSAPVAKNVKVELSSSAIATARVPAFVIIKAGHRSATFDLTIVDDAEIDGPQSATITAHVENWTDGIATMSIRDNETRNLVVALPARAREGDGVLPNAGAVHISGALPNDLVVSLVSDYPAVATVPSTVTIVAGQNSATFDVTIVDDSASDGVQRVTVTATAETFGNATGSFHVVDDDSSSQFVVNNTRDPAWYLNLNNGTLHWTEDPAGTLRYALFQADFSPGRDRIIFAIPGTGVQTINLKSALQISSPVIIDGSTQPGFQTGNPVVELSGATALQAATGLEVLTTNSTVIGLRINHFSVDGIFIRGGGQSVIQYCWVGADTPERLTYGNGSHGIVVIDSANNLIDSCLISGNSKNGVVFANGGSVSNTIQACLIGTDITGELNLGNGWDGILLSKEATASNFASHNFIGSTTPGISNVISGNGIWGIEAYGSSYNRILGNRIGVNRGGNNAIANSKGVSIYQGSYNTVGGTIPGQGNIISGNAGDGVQIYAGAPSFASTRGNKIQGNHIGTDLAGLARVPNQGNGVTIVSFQDQDADGAMDNLVGGDSSITDGVPGNLISGNTGNGVALIGRKSKLNVLQGNSIGSNKGGTQALGNGLDGVLITKSFDAADTGASENIIGGTTSSSGNLISGNGGNGIQLEFGSSGNLVTANHIGTTASGAAGLSNRLHGVAIRDSFTNVVGMARQQTDRLLGNQIAWNGSNGVTITGNASVGNTVRGNLIHDNFKLGIDLGNDGVTRNGEKTAPGPNDWIPYPTGLSTTYSSGLDTTIIAGKLDIANPQSVSIDIYDNNAADPTGFGEGKIYLGSTTPMSDGTFELTVSRQLYNRILSATATDANGSTSEFGPMKRPVIFIPGIAGSELAEYPPGNDPLWPRIQIPIVGEIDYRCLSLYQYQSTPPGQCDTCFHRCRLRTSSGP